MKTNPILLIAGICTAGFLCGFAGKRASGSSAAAVSTSGPAPPKTTHSSARDRADDGPDAKAKAKGKSVVAMKSNMRSTDTLETLAALDDAALYPRLALWLLDASEADVAAWWQIYKPRKNRANGIIDLTFINWSRLDPQAAINATKGSGDEHYAWWAWASHDPKNALAAAIATNQDRVNNVAWGIGEFHADWLMQHFDEIPESGHAMALRGLTKSADKENPLQVLEFLSAHDEGFHRGIFDTLIRKDPWSAYDWIQKHGDVINQYYGSSNGPMDQLVASMAETQPDALERLALQAPQGDARRKIEAAIFDNLVKTDPEAALEQATSTKAPKIASDRLAAVALAYLKTDPDKAVELTQKLFAANPDALQSYTWVSYPNGSSGSGNTNEKITNLVDQLIASDPSKLLASIPTTSTPHGNSGFNQVANKWAESDLPAFTNWVNNQTNDETRDKGASIISEQLAQQGAFQEAMEWAMSSKKDHSNIMSPFYNWYQTEPEEAKAWLQSASITADQKQSFESAIKSIESRDD